MSPRTKALLAALTLFVLGLGVGSFTTAFIGMRNARRSLAAGEGVGALQRGLERFHQDLVSELKPSPEQSVELEREFADLTRTLLETRRRQSRELLLELRAGGRRLRSSLDEAQRTRYDALVRRMILRYGLESRAPLPSDSSTTESPQGAKDK